MTRAALGWFRSAEGHAQLSVVKDRTGQVWEMNGQVFTIVSSEPHKHHPGTRHQVLMMTAHADPDGPRYIIKPGEVGHVVENEDRPFEARSELRRHDG